MNCPTHKDRPADTCGIGEGGEAEQRWTDEEVEAGIEAYRTHCGGFRVSILAALTAADELRDRRRNRGGPT